MITVQYKPLERMRPIHISILALGESTPSLHSIGEILGLPQMFLEHTADDLIAWGLIAIVDNQVKVLDQGTRCIAVWAATNKRGFWNIDGDHRWILGKGIFHFRVPLKSLSDAGLDAETGKVLSEAEAIKCLTEHRNAFNRVEREIQKDVFRAQIVDTVASEGNIPELIKATLGRAKNRLHLNRLCRQAEAALTEISNQSSQKNIHPTEFRRLLQQQRSQVERSMIHQWRETEKFTRRLLASWLAQQDGFLGKLAADEPSALLIRSDQENIPQAEKPTSHQSPLNHEQQVNPGSHHAKSSSMFDDVFKFMGSFFR